MPEESEGSIGIEAESSEVVSDSEQDVFAAGMWERPEVEDDGGAEGEPAETERTPSEPEVFVPSELNLSRTDPNDVPEGPMREMVEAAQRQFKGLQTTLNERQTELTTLRNGQPEEQQQPPQYQEAEYEPAPDPTNPYPYLDLPQGLTAHERQEVFNGAHQVNNIFDHRLQPYHEYLEAMPQIVGALVELVNRAQGAEFETVSDDRQDLVEAYGEQAPDEQAVQALALRVTNPATDELFTHREAYERVHGITADQVAALDAKRRAARSNAKRSGAGAPRANVTTPASDHLTAEEADRNMRAAGWSQ